MKRLNWNQRLRPGWVNGEMNSSERERTGYQKKHGNWLYLAASVHRIPSFVDCPAAVAPSPSLRPLLNPLSESVEAGAVGARLFNCSSNMTLPILRRKITAILWNCDVSCIGAETRGLDEMRMTRRLFRRRSVACLHWTIPRRLIHLLVWISILPLAGSFQSPLLSISSPLFPLSVPMRRSLWCLEQSEIALLVYFPNDHPTRNAQGSRCPHDKKHKF